MSTPYSYIGLGRTNNYVDNLFVGSTRHQLQHFVNLEGLIPNSQVVISPWQPPGQSDTASWTRELYLHPGDWIPSVIVTLGIATLVLGIVVVVLHINEKAGPASTPTPTRYTVLTLFWTCSAKMSSKGGERLIPSSASACSEVHRCGD